MANNTQKELIQAMATYLKCHTLTENFNNHSLTNIKQLPQLIQTLKNLDLSKNLPKNDALRAEFQDFQNNSSPNQDDLINILDTLINSNNINIDIYTAIAKVIPADELKKYFMFGPNEIVNSANMVDATVNMFTKVTTNTATVLATNLGLTAQKNSNTPNSTTPPQEPPKPK